VTPRAGAAATRTSRIRARAPRAEAPGGGGFAWLRSFLPLAPRNPPPRVDVDRRLTLRARHDRRVGRCRCSRRDIPSRPSRWPPTSTRSWVWLAAPAPTRSSAPTASSRPSCTPTRTRATARPRVSFKEVNHAYDVLGDAKKRALYDEFGEDALREGFDAERVRQYKKWAAQGRGTRRRRGRRRRPGRRRSRGALAPQRRRAPGARAASAICSAILFAQRGGGGRGPSRPVRGARHRERHHRSTSPPR